MPIQMVTDQIADGAVTGPKIPAGTIGGAHLDSTAKQAVLQSKVIGRFVQAAEQPNPNANSVDVKTLLGFNTTAGVDPEAQVKGKCCLLEAAGGNEFNTSSGKVGANAKARSSKCPVVDVKGDQIVDASGDQVWAVITATARTTGGGYTLRFFSGEFGSGNETPYTMNQGFVFAYPQIFDMADAPQWNDASITLVDKEAAQLAPGQIGNTELANNAVTSTKINAGAVNEGHLDPNAKLRLAETALDDRAVSTTQGKGFIDGNGTEGQVTAQGSPDMTVRVNTGGVAYNHQGSRLPFAPVATINIGAADPTNPRNDIVVVNAAGAIAVRQGTPAPSPADPNLTGGDAVLARVNVPANATQITGGQIVDLRERGSLDGSKFIAKTVSLKALSVVASYQQFNGNGSDTKFVLNNVVDPGWYAGVKAFRNGARIEYITGAPANYDQYRVIFEGGQTKVELGAALPVGQILSVDYLY